MYKIVVFTIMCIVSKTVYAKPDLNSLPVEIRQMLSNLHAACIDETGVSEAAINMATNGDFKDETPLKCYMKCLMTSIGVMEDDGTMDWETYEGLLPDILQEAGKKTIAKCGSIKSNGDGCETAFQINKCSYEADPDVRTLNGFQVL